MDQPIDHDAELPGVTVQVYPPGVQTAADAPLHNLPLTSSEGRMHVLSADCWCEPTVLSFGQGDGARVQEVDHQGQLAAGDQVTVEGVEGPGTIKRVRDDGALLIFFASVGYRVYRPEKATRWSGPRIS